MTARASLTVTFGLIGSLVTTSALANDVCDKFIEDVSKLSNSFVASIKGNKTVNPLTQSQWQTAIKIDCPDLMVTGRQAGTCLTTLQQANGLVGMMSSIKQIERTELPSFDLTEWRRLYGQATTITCP